MKTKAIIEHLKELAEKTGDPAQKTLILCIYELAENVADLEESQPSRKVDEEELDEIFGEPKD